MNLEKLLLLAIKASIEAGKEILEVYDSDFAIESKEDKSPLTAADKQSHEVIMKWLQGSGIPILSEEGEHLRYEERSGWEKLWIVDPLDGTKEFIKRNGEFTVNIALVIKQQPILGVIYIPVTSELYFSNKDIGAFKMIMEVGAGIQADKLNILIEQAKRLPLQHKSAKYTVVCSRSHLNPETEAFVNDLKQEHPEIDYASKGSSLKFCLIAEGKADIYPRFAPTMEWDTAAGQALVEASGGSVIRHDGTGRLLYNKENLLNPWFIVSRLVNS